MSSQAMMMSRSEGRLRHRPMTVADPGSQALRSGVSFSVTGQLGGWAESEVQIGGGSGGVGGGGKGGGGGSERDSSARAVTVNLLPTLNSN